MTLEQMTIRIRDSPVSSSDQYRMLLLAGVAYNQPKLCIDAKWSPNATTVLRNANIGSSPHGLFVDGYNLVYIANRVQSSIIIFDKANSTTPKTITGTYNRSMSVFVSIDGDVYIDNGFANRRVDKWSSSTSTVVSVLPVNGSCYGLFIDPNNTLYCSLSDFHSVIKSSLPFSVNNSMIAAGNGIAGFSATMLDSPRGIYVDQSFNLHVADCGNDRIQQFQSLQSNGITIAGNESSQNITLNCPTGVVLDSDGYLFIVDSFNHRVVGQGPTGFRCLVGCSGISGASSSQLSFPQSMAFDSYGNLYVTDRNNSRVQKFDRQNTTCRKFASISAKKCVECRRIMSMRNPKLK